MIAWGILFVSVLAHAASAQDNPLLSKLRRRCLSDLNSWRKPEYSGEFFSYTNSTGNSEAECAQNCIERLEFCTAAMFIPERNVCLYSYKVLHCEDGSRRSDVPTSPYYVLHCISCLGVVPDEGEDKRLGGSPAFGRPGNSRPSQFIADAGRFSRIAGTKLSSDLKGSLRGPPLLGNSAPFQGFPGPQPPSWPTLPHPWPPSITSFGPPGAMPDDKLWPEEAPFKETKSGYPEETYNPPSWPTGNYASTPSPRAPSWGELPPPGNPSPWTPPPDVPSNWGRTYPVTEPARTLPTTTPSYQFRPPATRGFPEPEDFYYTGPTPEPYTFWASPPPLPRTQAPRVPITPAPHPFYPPGNNGYETRSRPGPRSGENLGWPTKPPLVVFTPGPTKPPQKAEYNGSGKDGYGGYEKEGRSDNEDRGGTEADSYSVQGPYTLPPRFFTTAPPAPPHRPRKVQTLVPPPPKPWTEPPPPPSYSISPPDYLPGTESPGQSIWFPTVPPAKISIFGAERLDRKFQGPSKESKSSGGRWDLEGGRGRSRFPELNTALPPFDVDEEFPLQLFTLRPPGTVLSFVAKTPRPTRPWSSRSTQPPPILYEREKKPDLRNTDFKTSPDASFVNSDAAPKRTDIVPEYVPSLGAIPGPVPVTVKGKDKHKFWPTTDSPSELPLPSNGLGTSFDEFWRAISRIGNKNLWEEKNEGTDIKLSLPGPRKNPSQSLEKTKSSEHFNSLRDPKLRNKIDRLTKRVSNGINTHLLHLPCPANLLKPCIFGFGMGCKLVRHEDGCLLCSCPYRSPARGCSGPQGLTSEERLDLLLFRNKCPDGRMSQNVHRYSRMREADFDDCVMSKQPYCGWLQDVNTWRMPRTKAECYYYCYSEQERKERNIVVRRTRRLS